MGGEVFTRQVETGDRLTASDEVRGLEAFPPIKWVSCVLPQKWVAMRSPPLYSTIL